MTSLDTAGTYLTPSEIARRLKLDPSAPVRWMRRGVLLTDGSRLRLEHLCVPSGYRVKQECLDAFLQTLSADRAGKVYAAPKGPARSARITQMNAALAAAGLLPKAGKRGARDCPPFGNGAEHEQDHPQELASVSTS
jgi:hypothetical protein